MNLRPCVTAALAAAVVCAGIDSRPYAQAAALPQIALPRMMTWTIDGDTREAIVYAPTAPPAPARVPLVLSFHGRGDDIQNFQHTDLHLAWPGAVVVYFQGLDGRGGLSGWQVERGESRDRDVKLLR